MTRVAWCRVDRRRHVRGGRDSAISVPRSLRAMGRIRAEHCERGCRSWATSARQSPEPSQTANEPSRLRTGEPPARVNKCSAGQVNNILQTRIASKTIGRPAATCFPATNGFYSHKVLLTARALQGATVVSGRGFQRLVLEQPCAEYVRQLETGSRDRECWCRAAAASAAPSIRSRPAGAGDPGCGHSSAIAGRSQWPPTQSPSSTIVHRPFFASSEAFQVEFLRVRSML